MSDKIDLILVDVEDKVGVEGERYVYKTQVKGGSGVTVRLTSTEFTKRGHPRKLTVTFSPEPVEAPTPGGTQ